MATITSLDFNIKSNWDGSGIKEARGELDLLKTDLQEISDTRAEATVGVNIDKTGLDEFKTELDQIANTRVTATASVNVDDAGLTRLRTELTQVGDMHIVATASVNTDTARLDALRTELDAVGRTHATATASANVNSASLDAFDAKLTRLGNTHVTATAGVNTNSTALDSLEANLARFGSTRATATASVNTNAGNLDALQARLTAFGASRHTSTADVNTDSAHSHLTRMEGDLGSAVRGAGDLASAAGGAGSAIGGMGSAAGGGANAVNGLAGAANSGGSGMSGLATAISVVVLAIGALDAIAPIAAASIVLIPVAFIGVATAIIATNKKLQKSFKETFQDALQKAIPLVMPVIAALEKSFKQLDGWLTLIGPAIKAAFSAAAPLVQPLFNILEKLVGGALPGFTGAMRNMGPLLDGLGQGALKLGGYLGQMALIFSRIPGLGQAMNGIMGALGQVLVAVAQSIASVVSMDHGQLLIQFLQSLAVLIKASIPLFQFVDIELTGMAVIMRGVGDVLIALEAAFRAFFQLLSGQGPIMSAFAVAWNATWSGLKTATLATWDGLTVAWKATVSGLSTAWSAVSGALMSSWNVVWNGMQIAAKAIWAAMQVAWSAVVQAFATVWTSVSSALVTAWNAVWNGMKTSAQAIWNAMQTAWSAFTSALGTAFGAFSSAMKTAWDGLWSALSTAYGAFSSAMKTAWNGLWSAISTAYGAFSSAMKTAWNGLWSALSTAYGAFSSAMKTAWNGLWSAISTAYGAFSSAMKNAWNGLWSVLSSVYGTFSGALKNAWHGMLDALSSAWSAFSSGIKKAVQGTVDGIKTIWHGLEDAFKAPIHFVVDTVINNGILKALNWVIDHLGGHSNLKAPVPFASGGEVNGPGSGTSDSILARLSNGEHVWTAAEVQAAGGHGMMAQMRANALGAGSVRTMGSGGFASGGGVSGGLSVGDIESMFGDIIKSIGGAGAGILAKAIGGAGSLAKAVGGGVQGAANAVGNAAGHIPGVGGAAKSVIKGIGHLFGGGGKKVASATNAIADALAKWGKKEFDSAAGDLIDKVLEKLPIPDGNGPIGLIGSGGTKAMMKAAADHLKGIISGFLFSQNQTNVQSHAVAGPKAVQAWAPVVLQALQMTGHPASWLAPILLMMSRESGGNPNAINRTDINAQHGIPSQGLMQVIPPTFAANHEPGTSNNILDPLANIAAAINYIAKVPSRLGQTPYATGTSNATAGMHLVGENGPEMVMFGGGETVKTASETSGMLGGSGAQLPTDQMAQNQALWASYVNSLATSSSTAWASIKKSTVDSLNAQGAQIAPFSTSLKNTFNTTGTMVASQWKANWDNNQKVFAGDLATTQTNGTTFNDALKKNFQETGTQIGNTWKTDWDNAATQMQTNFTTMGSASTAMWAGQKATFNAGSAYLTNTFFPPVNDLMVNKLPASFSTSVTNIGAGWLHLEGATHDPVAAVVNVVYNKGIVAVWNQVAKAFGAPPLATFTMPGFAVGGQVSGPGTGTSDSVVARLSHGEHVWTAKEVQAAGGHGAVANMRSSVLGAGVRSQGTGDGRYAAGGAVIGGTPGGAPQGAPTVAGSGGAVTGSLANAVLGSIHQIANPLIDAAIAAGKTAVDAVSIAGSGMRTAGENMGSNMGKAAEQYITQNDVAPTFGGGNDTSAQAWADSRVGEPYVLGGDFVNGIDCSEYQSGIARAILGQTPAPWFTTFAFNGSTAPAGFVQNLTAPYMVGVTNAGVGHMAGTLNGKNYEATPPAVRSGPSARGWNDPMFPMHYGFQPSVQAAGLPTNASHLQIIDAAMAAAHVPPPDTQSAWESGLNIIITNESAWNPNAINNTDINAQNGIPSQGLAQVIPPTFAAYHVAGTSTNILDPLANVAAAIRYIVSVYGSINNVPGVRSVNAGGGYLPYRHGTNNATMGWHLVGEDGPEVRWFNGGEKVWDSSKTKDFMHKLHQSGPVPTGGGDSAPIVVENHWHGNPTKEAVQEAEGPMVDKLRQACKARVGGRAH